jgi:hypothetical protein
MRSRICELHSIGWGAKRIYYLHREIPLATIKTTIRKEAIRKDNVTLPRSGAPRKISEEEQDHIYDLTQDPHIKMRELLDEVSTPLTKKTIQQLLRDMHKTKWLQKVRPLLEEEHANKRLAWANCYAYFTSEDWN